MILREPSASRARTLRVVILMGVAGAERLERRAGHFMKPGMLASQLAALEPPEPREAALAVEVAGTPEEIAAEIRRRLSIPSS
jgi:gluconate kinase